MMAPVIRSFSASSGDRSDGPGFGETSRANGDDQERIAELESQVAELDAFTGSVSHDLRAPLRTIIGFARILREDHSAELTGDAHACVTTIVRATREMERMIEDLLLLSRAGAQPIAMAEFETQALVSSVLRALLPQPADSVRLKVGELHNCLGHAGLLRHVWMNLLSNALKFARERDPAEIEVGSTRSKHTVTYHVRDNGVGLDMEQARELFLPFRRFHDTRRFDGHGMGLAIVRRIVRRHSGRVWAEGRPGKGMTFYFSLPGV